MKSATPPRRWPTGWSRSTCRSRRKVGDNDTLYGSVTNGDIADLLKEKGFDIDRRKILLPDPLRALGEAHVPVKLHRDVTAQLKITVVKEA